MKRDTRLSRALVSGVGGTLTLALVFWAYNLGKSHGTTAPQQAAPLVAIIDPALTAKALAQPASTAPAALATELAPATQPSAPLLAATTQRSADTAETATARQGECASDVLISASSLADAKAKLDAGKLLDARRILSAALSSGTLADTDVKSVKQLLNQINAKAMFSPGQLPGDELTDVIRIPSGGSLSKIAVQHDMDIDMLVRMNAIRNKNSIKAGAELKVIRHGPFNALVDKSDFVMELWLGDPGSRGAVYITSFPVGLGANDSTPTGVWAVGNKLVNPTYYSPRGEGIIDAGDPKNPLGDRWIALSGTDGQAVGKTSYGIHGTIDPASIGKQESMGCIRMKNEDVAVVYEALVTGKSIVIVRE